MLDGECLEAWRSRSITLVRGTEERGIRAWSRVIGSDPVNVAIRSLVPEPERQVFDLNPSSIRASE